ncbi:hypothetical protein L9F63_008705 [Diploptera punctata]|uniref:Sialin n=1 Tax=Diploptera punctata TaxID=6984 RepID=A0AAD7Z4U1_DIPPU|nr:hypothetical protein L9F63_008705 [Diploptera punctata]
MTTQEQSPRLEKFEISQSEGDGLGSTWLFWKRRRNIVAIMAFFGFFGVYAMRVNLSVAIVAMTSEKNVTLRNGTIATYKEFDWSPTVHGLVLSSFFYGYIFTQIPGGWLGARFGGSIVYGVGVGVTALFTLLTPPLVWFGVDALIAVRVIEGLFEGMTYPCMHAVWGKWAPPLERSRLASFATSGSHVGTVISLPMSGLLANYFGWESIFYVFGAVVAIWLVLWLWIVKSRPEDDPKITPEELKYIENALGTVGNKHPWSKIMTSPAVWAIIVAHFSENWGFYTLLTQLPTFMKEVLGYEVQKGGLMSAIPYLLMAMVLMISGRVADWLIANRYLTTTKVRKLFTCGAFLAQTVFMLMAALTLTPFGSVAGLSVAVGLGGFALSGFFVNHLDLAPIHAPVLMGISNTVATLPGIISPLLTGYLVQDKTASEWQMVFYIASGIYLFGAIIYGIFASGELQSWAEETGLQEEGNNDVDKTAHCYTNKAMVDDAV